jgi:uroporphyrinogen III methyltransferase / synthase
VLPLYETVAEPLPQQTLQAAANADYITFTSSSTVRFFLQSAGRAAEDAQGLLSPATRIVSIGPVTSQTLRDAGLPPHVEARPHDIDGLVEALLDDARAIPSSR